MFTVQSSASLALSGRAAVLFCTPRNYTFCGGAAAVVSLLELEVAVDSVVWLRVRAYLIKKCD